jgi:regulatory protein
MSKIRLSSEMALQKIRQYCIYQERCHAEVRQKLYSFGLSESNVEQLISQLIEEDYLNEERFAMQYAGGKFRMNKWGKMKIKQALKQKEISEYSIRKALKQINDEDYMNILNKLGEEKLRKLRSEKNIFIKKRKLRDYLLQKGYEAELIRNLYERLK